MFYPGQAVYYPEEKRLGIYLGYTYENKYPYDKILYVYTLFGKDASDSVTQIYEPKDLQSLSVPSKESITGQLSYRTPFQRNSLTKEFSDEDATAHKEAFRAQLLKISRAKWFKDKYELNLKP